MLVHTPSRSVRGTADGLPLIEWRHIRYELPVEEARLWNANIKVEGASDLARSLSKPRFFLDKDQDSLKPCRPALAQA